MLATPKPDKSVLQGFGSPESMVSFRLGWCQSIRGQINLTFGRGEPSWKITEMPHSGFRNTEKRKWESLLENIDLAIFMRNMPWSSWSGTFILVTEKNPFVYAQAAVCCKSTHVQGLEADFIPLSLLPFFLPFSNKQCIPAFSQVGDTGKVGHGFWRK